MRRAHLDAGGSLQFSLQLTQVKVRLGFQQTPHCLPVHPHLRPRLISLALSRTGALPCTRNLPRPRKAHTKLIRQLRKRSLAQIVSLQQLPTKIVTIGSRHPSSFNLNNKPAKNQPIYHQIISSKNAVNRKNVVISTGDARLYRAAEWRNPRILLLLFSVDLSAALRFTSF